MCVFLNCTLKDFVDYPMFSIVLHEHYSKSCNYTIVGSWQLYITPILAHCSTIILEIYKWLPKLRCLTYRFVKKNLTKNGKSTKDPPILIYVYSHIFRLIRKRYILMNFSLTSLKKGNKNNNSSSNQGTYENLARIYIYRQWMCKTFWHYIQ